MADNNDKEARGWGRGRVGCNIAQEVVDTDTHIADSEGSNSPPRTRGSACSETNTHEEMMANVLKLALRCQRNIEEKVIHHAMMAD